MTISLLAKSDHTILINKKVITNIPGHHCWRHRCTVDCCVVPKEVPFQNQAEQNGGLKHATRLAWRTFY